MNLKRSLKKVLRHGARIREPKTKTEFWCSITYALIITGILAGMTLVWFNVTDAGSVTRDKSDYYGLYYPENDSIWINENITGERRERTISHEKLHRQFFNTLPFYQFFRYFSVFMLVFLTVLGVTVERKKYVYVGMSMLFFVVIPEHHAYLVFFSFSSHRANRCPLRAVL